jgi:hypothetical protein
MMIAPEIQSDWLVKKNSMNVSVSGAGLIRQAARPGSLGLVRLAWRQARAAGHCCPLQFDLGRLPPQERRNPAFGLVP